MMQTIRDIGPVALVSIALILVVVAAILAAIENEREWQAFAKDHCKVVAKEEGTTLVSYGVVLGPDGRVSPGHATTYSPGKTAYACDDGVTYWR